MKKIIDFILVIGFLLVDFLIFHDILKVGEIYTTTEYLTGILSIIVIVTSLRSLFKK